MRNHLVQRCQAAGIGPFAIGKGNGRWLQPRCRWAIAIAVGPVAAGALLGVQLGPLRQIGHKGGRHREGVGLHQAGRRPMGQFGHLVGSGFVMHRLLQLSNLLGQGRALRMLGQRRNLLLGGGGEIQHLGVFALAGNHAVFHGTAVIHGHIFQQLPQLARLPRHLLRLGGSNTGHSTPKTREKPPKFAMHKPQPIYK